MKNERGVIISVISQKGGTGKSTIIENIAVGFARDDADTVIIDCDARQKTATYWLSRRHDADMNKQSLKTINGQIQQENYKEGILDAANRYDVTLVDVPGHDGRALRSSLITSDIIYITSRPSQNDLETLTNIVELIKETEDLNPNRKIHLLLTQCPTHAIASEVREAEEFLKEYINLMPISKVKIAYRKTYRDASAEGLGVLEINDSSAEKAKFEISQLMKEIMSYV